MRAGARGCEVDPHTGLAWVIEVAEHATACSRAFLHDGRGTQVPRDERLALLRAVKAGAVRETEAIRRLARSPQGVWPALAPLRKGLRTVDGGDRPLAMAQRVGHQVVQVLAPGCVPRCLTDGFKE
jgi:hypothetical protein